MAISAQEQTGTVTLPSASHSTTCAEQIAEAMSILKAQRQLGPRVRVETIVLHEPDKDLVLDFQPGDHIQRNAFVVILDNDEAATYEAVVSLNERRVISWKHVPGVQPRVMFDEFSECEAAVRANPEFQVAIKKRGITDPSLVMVDPWSAGSYGFDDEEGRRLVLARNFLRSSRRTTATPALSKASPHWSTLTIWKSVRVDDYGVIPLPPQPRQLRRRVCRRIPSGP